MQECSIFPLLSEDQGIFLGISVVIFPQTNLLKSQINHILTQMEQRGWIERIRSTSDKRVIYVHLSDLGRESYLKEHAKVLEILNTVHRELGSEKTLELTTLLNRATSIVHAYERNH